MTCNLGDGFWYVTADSTTGVAQAFCPAGTVATSGGGITEVDEPTVLAVSTSFFDEESGLDSWFAGVKNIGTGVVGGSVGVEAYCWTGPFETSTELSLSRRSPGLHRSKTQDALVRQYIEAAR